MNLRATLTVFATGLASLCCSDRSSDIPPYMDESRPIEVRVEDALSRMTVKEKINIIHAQSKFSSPGVPRLGIPELWCTDGPHGIRPEVLWDKWDQAGWSNDSCTAFPALTCLAATWNRDMAALYGKSIGEEARYREKDVLLGPGVNICCTPLNGRNFEYMGEDPYLASQMVVPYVRGVQQNGVAACVKHYALNNEETHRHTVDVDLSDRALYEIYLPAFKAAVKDGGAWSIMGSYNLYRGEHGCHNKRLLCDILKGEWGFDGAVISDWGGAHDTREAITNGLDLEYGTWTDGLAEGTVNAYDNYRMAVPYLRLIEKGEVGTGELDDKARRVLRLIFRTAMNTRKPYGALCSEEHFEAARRIGEEGIVLLKNDDRMLPLKSVKTIAVVGENAVKMMTVGGGSSSLKTQHEVSPFDGLKARAAREGIEVIYARGYVGDITGRYNGVETGQNLADDRTPGELTDEAVEAARRADAVIFVGGLNKSVHQDCEGRDRRHLELPYDQDSVIAAIAEANPNTVVVLVSGNPVAMPWAGRVKSIVEAWYMGSEAGNSLAAVLFGDVNPSGKLPFTFPVELEDVPAHFEGTVFPNNGKTYYDEGIYVGYRGFEKRCVRPLFCFGHGLSYTTFEYGQLQLDKNRLGKRGTLKASIEVTNSGPVDGAEVVQLYVGQDDPSVDRPIKELKGFEKVFLKAGETRTVTFEIDAEALAYYDEKSHAWRSDKGFYTLLAGSSSEDIRSTARFGYRR